MIHSMYESILYNSATSFYDPITITYNSVTRFTTLLPITPCDTGYHMEPKLPVAENEQFELIKDQKKPLWYLLAALHGFRLYSLLWDYNPRYHFNANCLHWAWNVISVCFKECIATELG